VSQPKSRSASALNDISEVILHETFKTNPKTPQLFDFQKFSESLFHASRKHYSRQNGVKNVERWENKMGISWLTS